MSLTPSEKTYITEKFANWKPGRIRYWESLPSAETENSGEARPKPALLMIHGYGAMLEHWRQTFAGLKGQYRLYAFDLLGFGGSAKPNGAQVNYSARLWSRQVYDFLKLKGEEKVIIAGHSMGGMVALEFAFTHPEMVAGLVLVDAAGLPDQGKLEQEAARLHSRNPNRIDWSSFTYNLIKAPLLGETMAALLTLPNQWAIRRFLENAYYNKNRVTPQLVEQFLEPLRMPGVAGSYLAITRNFANYQLTFKPGEISGPVLIMWGEHDRNMPVDLMVPRWKKLLPQAEVFRVPDTAHCPMDERPDLVNPRLSQFIEQVAAGKWQPDLDHEKQEIGA